MDVRTQPFKAQVAHYLEAEPVGGASLWMGPTPAVLRMLGFPELPLRMSRGVLHKIYTGKGGQRPGLDVGTICRLPMLLDEPDSVFASATVDGALVVVTTAKTKHGLVIASVGANLLDANVRVNCVTSAYTKDRPEWLTTQIAEGRMLYTSVTKEKGPDTPEVSCTTLNRGAEPGSRSLERTLLGYDDLVKFRAEQRAKKLDAVGVAA